MSVDNSTAFKHFGLSCPSGGDYYICQGTKTEFVGCCTSDPCANDGDCPQDDLRYSTFKADTYEDLPTQDCDDSRGIDIWYTCKFANPPFMGCCSENACGANGCPRAALRPAMLSSHEENVLNFLEPAEDSKPSSTNTPSTGDKDKSSDGGGGLGTGAIIGIAVGAAIIGVLILAFLAWKFWWLPKKKAQHQPLTPSMNQPDTPGTYNGGFAPHNHGQSPMSGYQQSFASTPTAVSHYPSGTTNSDMYNKYSPAQQSPAMYSDVSHHQQQQQYQQYPPSTQQMNFVHEMDGNQTAPQEMSAGYDQDHHSTRPKQDHIDVTRS